VGGQEPFAQLPDGAGVVTLAQGHQGAPDGVDGVGVVGVEVGSQQPHLGERDLRGGHADPAGGDGVGEDAVRGLSAGLCDVDEAGGSGDGIPAVMTHDPLARRLRR